MRQPHALAVAFGKLADRLVHDLVDAAQVAELADAAQIAGGVQAAQIGHEPQVVEHQHVMVQGGRFRQVAEDFFDFQKLVLNAIVPYLNATGSGLQETGQHAQRGGLAGAVGTEQPQDLASLDVERDLVHRADIIEILGKVFDTDHSIALLVRNSRTGIGAIKN
jgi:hypothetical protein